MQKDRNISRSPPEKITFPGELPAGVQSAPTNDAVLLSVSIPKSKFLYRIFGLLFYLFALLALLVVSLKLFAPNTYNHARTITAPYFNQVIHAFQQQVPASLVIVSPWSLTSLEPMTFTSVNRARLINIYESLVRLDRNLRLEPSLALSYGRIDDVTWEFRLRKNVFFHHGKKLTSDDVASSFVRAKEHPDSEIGSLVASINRIDILTEDIFRLITKTPDTFLLNKLSAVPIVPSDVKDLVRLPTGTGPYRFVSNRADSLYLESFPEYWGSLPAHPTVEFRTVTDREERTKLLISREAHIAVGVPPDSISLFEQEGWTIRRKPGLEVNFILFNVGQSTAEGRDSRLTDVRLRRAFSIALDRQVLLSLGQGFARPVTQFVSSGVFGYNPDIAPPSYDLDAAKKLLREAETFRRIPVTLTLPKELVAVGDYIREQLFRIGMDVYLDPVSPADIFKKLQTGDFQAIFLGWRSDLGDASDFLNSIVHTRTDDGFFGRYNGGYYSNINVDRLIEMIEATNNDAERLSRLQDIMKILVEDDIFGLPLFEPETIYAVSPELRWEPRLDGYILATDVFMQ